jgi:tetratricopeptide (TPR) repeat protein
MWTDRSIVRASLSAVVLGVLAGVVVWVTRADAPSAADCTPARNTVAELGLQRAAWYDGRQLALDAEREYVHVVASQCGAGLYATERIGELELDRGNAQVALDTFLRVLSTPDPDNASVIAGARSGYVRAFAKLGSRGSAFAAFRVVAPAHALEMLAELADIYLADGRATDAIGAYRELIAAAPADRHACLWQYNVAHTMLNDPNASDDARVTEIERLVARSRASELPAAEAKECHDNAWAMASDVSRAYHVAHQLAYADRLYSAYLAAFGDAPDFAVTQYFAAEARWSLAEATSDAAHWQRAAETFDRAVKTGGLPATLGHEAPYAAMLAWKNACNNGGDASCNAGLLAALQAYRPYAPTSDLAELDGMAARLAAQARSE